MPRQNTHYLCSFRQNQRQRMALSANCQTVYSLHQHHLQNNSIYAGPDDLRIVTGCCNRKSAFFYLICCGLLPNGRTAGGATRCKACQKPCNGQHTNHFFLNHTQTPAFRFHPIEPASDVHDGLDYREDFPLSLFLCVHGIP